MSAETDDDDVIGIYKLTEFVSPTAAYRVHTPLYHCRFHVQLLLAP